jgi:hypothetical protein
MKKLLPFVATMLLLAACQRDVEGDLEVINSSFTFTGASGACTTPVISGTYTPGTPLNASNTVTLSVNVQSTGAYTITTNTTNGYKFSGSGVFTSTGLKTIVLTGSGTPLAAQADIFTPASGTGITGCSFTISMAPATPAVFTYGGAPGTCTGVVVSGTYAQGVALTASNTISIQVNVTTAGTYTITSSATAGITFSKSGSFASTGIQTVVLTGTGTPTASGIQNFTVGAPGCNFSITITGPATYTLSGTPGACTGAVVNGTYASGVTLTAANTVTVQANVTVTGSYTITTNTVSGFVFSKTGVFTTTGVQNVVLNGSGTPTAGGATVFTVGTGGCTFSVNVTGPAVYSFSGAPGACTVATVAGTYTMGTTLTAANTVTVQVNVTTVGAYNISTTAGGMTFSKSGIFASTGVQSVILAGSGTPSVSGAVNFTVGTGGCTFSISVTAATAFYSCKIDGVFTSFTDRAQGDITDDFYTPPLPYLYVNGYTGPATGGVVPQFQIFIVKNDNSSITTGTYNVDGILLPNGYRIEIDYTLQNPDLSTTIWNTSSTLFPPPNPPFTVIVTSISATRVRGTFSGTLTNTLAGSTLFKTITEGVFDLPVF